MARNGKPNPKQVPSKREQLAAVEIDLAGARLTTDQGIPVQDTDNSLRAGARGPSLLEDFHLR